MLPRPLRPLLWLLRVASSRDAASAALGDVFEDLTARRSAGRAPRWPRFWINLQIARAIALAFRADLPRSLRASGLVCRDAVRALRSAPGQPLFVVLVLAVGIASGTVTFSVVDAVLLKPLPFEQPEQLVWVSTRGPTFQDRNTPDQFWRLRDELQSVDSVAAYSRGLGGNVQIGDVERPLVVARASADVFRVLRLSPAIGRFWSEEEEARGDRQVAVLSYSAWQEYFRGDPAVLGTEITIDRWKPRIIGVLSAESDHPEVDVTAAPIWVPLSLPRTPKEGYPFGVLARMRPGVSTAQLAADVQRITGTDWRPDVTRLLDASVDSVRHWMLLALGAAGLVVLIACVNAANLMLTRATGRAQEMAVRASLGGSRYHLAGAMLVEGLLLSFAATACALACAVVGIRIARAAITTMLLGVFRASTIALDGRVLLAGVVAAVVTGVLVSLVPAWQMARSPASNLLRNAESTTGTSRRRWRSLFLTAEMASVVVLLVVSWLFVVSLVRVVSVDLGVDQSRLLAVNPRMPFSAPVDEVRRRLEQVAGVAGVAVSRGASLPLVGRAYGGAWITTNVERPDSEAGRASQVEVLMNRVTANYFDVAGLTFLRGGTWSEETAASEPPIVLDSVAARQIFGNGDPLGRVVRATEPEGLHRVVGVVPRVYTRGPEEEVQPSVYFPLPPSATRTFAGLFVRTSRPPEEVLPIVVEALKPVAPTVNEPYVFLADEAVRRITATRRFNGGVMSGFGLVGLLIAAAGVFAVMASFVAQQTREIGVRLALGATPARIQRGVLSLAWRHVLAGLAIGVPIAWWVSRGFTALLFQVTPADPSVYVSVAAILGAVAMLAAWIPARRAARVDPIKSLRA